MNSSFVIPSIFREMGCCALFRQLWLLHVGKICFSLSFYPASCAWKSVQWPAVQVRGVRIIKCLRLKACYTVHKQEKETLVSLVFQARKVFCPSHILCCHTAAKSMQLLTVQKTDFFSLSACLVLAFISTLWVCRRFSLGHSYCSTNMEGLMDSFLYSCVAVFTLTSSIAKQFP